MSPEREAALAHLCAYAGSIDAEALLLAFEAGARWARKTDREAVAEFRKGVHPILERIGHGGLVLTEEPEGVRVTWDRRYPCGDVCHGNELVRSTRAEALAAVLDYEDEQDARDSQDDPRDRCLICFPVREGEDRP